MTLAPIDKNAVSVVSMLEQAKTWLATAVDVTGPEDIAAVKAQIRTAEVYAKELGLSKEIQLDATEMVRRAEYALGRSIRKGQQEGSVRWLGDNAKLRDDPGGDITRVPTVKDIAPEFYNNGADMAAMVDGVEPEVFEAAIDTAKAEGNLSRANVVRKVRQRKPVDQSRAAKADVIEDLASRGYTSRQMASQVGVLDGRVREIAREYGIDIPADRVVGKQRRIDHTAAVESAVTELDNLVSSLSFIDFSEVDPSEAAEWAISLTDSLRLLNRFTKQIKEMTHD